MYIHRAWAVTILKRKGTATRERVKEESLDSEKSKPCPCLICRMPNWEQQLVFYSNRTEIRFVPISAKYGICTILGLNETLIPNKSFI